MRWSLASRFVALSMLLVVGLLAAPALAQTDEADLRDFCSARFDLDQALDRGDTDAAGEATARLVESAPAAVLDAAQTLANLVSEGDEDAFESDEARAAQETIDSYVIAHCGYRVVAVTGVDYQFQGVPKVVEAGVVAFNFANAADSEDHELVIVRVKRGVKGSPRKLLGLPDDQLKEKVELVTVAFAKAGESDLTITDLEPGRYLATCMIPVHGKDGNKPHWRRGMYAPFRAVVT